MSKLSSKTTNATAEFTTSENAENSGFATKGRVEHLCVSLDEFVSVSVNVGGEQFGFWFLSHDGKQITCDVAVPRGSKRAKVFKRSSSENVCLDGAEFIALCFD